MCPPTEEKKGPSYKHGTKLIADEKLFVEELGRDNDDIVRTATVFIEIIPVGSSSSSSLTASTASTDLPDAAQWRAVLLSGPHYRFHRRFSCWLEVGHNGGRSNLARAKIHLRPLKTPQTLTRK
ncbi:hypothetical protein ACLOJK_041282 [Asimina triloba]